MLMRESASGRLACLDLSIAASIMLCCPCKARLTLNSSPVVVADGSDARLSCAASDCADGQYFNATYAQKFLEEDYIPTFLLDILLVGRSAPPDHPFNYGKVWCTGKIRPCFS